MAENRAHKHPPKAALAAEPTMRDYIEILYRWKYVILGSLIGVFGSVALYTFLGHFIYESTAIVQVGTKPSAEVAFGSLDVAGLTSTRNLMKEVNILKSRTIADDVIAKLKSNPVATLGGKDTLPILHKGENDPTLSRYATSETIIERLAQDCSFDPNTGADVIYITDLSTNPKEAAIIANHFAQAYYENNLKASRKQLRTTREFLERTLQSKKLGLDAVEDSLRQYIELHGEISEEGQSTVRLIASLDARKDEVEIEILTTKSLINNYQKRINEIRAILPPDLDARANESGKRILELVMSFEIQKLLEQIAKLETQRDVIREQNTNARDQELVRRKVDELTRQIDAARNQIKAKVTSSGIGEKAAYDQVDILKDLNAKILDAKIKLQALEVRLQAIMESLTKNEEQYKDIPRQNLEYARLQRSKMSLEEVYITIEEKYQSALVAEQSQFGYVDILQNATPAATFISPNIPKNLGFGFFAGLILGISLAFLINNFDDRVHKPDEIKKLGLSILTVIPIMDDQIRTVHGRPHTPTGTIDGVRGTIKREFLSEEQPAGEKALDPCLITAINPYSRIADSYRRLRTSIQYWKQSIPIRIILVTSGAPREGKSITSANLAVVFAQSKKRTILVDVDLRRPSIHTIFGLKLEPGLTEVMFSEVPLTSAIQTTFVENLDILTCGSIPLNPSELISSPAMSNILEELKSIYDVVILDSPPILLFTDAELLVSLADAVAFVVKGESTMLNDIEHAVDLVEGIKMNFAGVVYNHYVFNRLHRGYYHLHGDYYYQQKYAPQEKT